MVGDACVTVSLAGSLFFTAPTEAARGSVLLYLALTLAPFSVIAPIIGPALDRAPGGRRMMVTVSCAGRLVLALLLARHLDTWLLYPEAFGILVLGKAHSIAKSSLVPGLVRDQTKLVEANSRLALLSVIAGVVGGAPAVGISKLLGTSIPALIFAAVAFGVGAVASVRIPRPAPEPEADTDLALEHAELHAPSIVLGATAMAVLRGAVGFYTFFIAFQLKDSVFALGMAIAGAGIGGFLGTVIAAPLRQRVREEMILAGSVLVPAVVALLSVRSPERLQFATTALFVAVGAAAGRLGFDSIVQRDAPDAVRGRSFARFETRFQLVWVAGGLLGLIPMTGTQGLAALAIVLAFTGVTYAIGLRAAHATVERRRRRVRRVRAAVWREVGRRFRSRPDRPPAPDPESTPSARPAHTAPADAARPPVEEHPDAFPGGS